MRKLRIDLSNKLTDYGVELLYRKLFDKNTEYNKAFFTSLEDIRKLRLYHSEGYVEPYKEECTVVDYEYIQFNYYYENLNDYTITKLVLEDEIDKILNIENQYISVNDPENYDSNVTCVMCRFVVSRNDNRPNSMNSNRRWIPVTVTDEGVKYIYEAWANLRNEKVNFFYTGNGEPNNTFENCHIMHLLDDVKVRDVQYWGRYCLLEGRKPFPYNTTTLSELGLGFYLKPHLYIRNYLATMDRNYAGDLFPIDRSYMENPNTLEYDHPVLALRLHEDDYICVWYSGKKATEEDETNFPNIAFSAKFYVNVIYGIWYDEDSIQWKDKPIQDKGLGLIENLGLLDSQTIEVIEPDMFPTATVIAEINGSSPVPIYTACTWVQNYNYYAPVRVITPSSTSFLQDLFTLTADYDTDLGSFLVTDYGHSEMKISSASTVYPDARYIQTLAEASLLYFEEYGISVSFVNNRMDLPPIIFEDKNLTYALDFDTFGIPTITGELNGFETYEYFLGTDYNISYTLTENGNQLIYTGHLDVIPGSTLATNLSRAFEHTFDYPEFHLTQKSLTFEKDIDFTLTYTKNNYGFYYFAINIVPGSNLEHVIGALAVYGYNVRLLPNRPSAIAMEEIEEGGSRTITLATAGRFKASNIPNFVPTFEGDFTFF